MFSFNLINEPWIPCRNRASNSLAPELLSLTDTFAQAKELSEIVGDSPPVTIGLHRLLLAILHRSLGTLDVEDWRQAWDAKAWDNERITRYLHEHAERFDLFDTEHPFYQSTATVQPQEGKDTVAKLFYQMDSNPTLFDHSMVATPPALSPARVARLLISFQSFDVSGTRKTDKGKITVTASPLVQSAVGLVRGASLFETLMLNLYWDDIEFFTDFSDPSKKDKPAWERDEATHPATRQPTGYLDLLTWQSRRIRLHPEQDAQGNTVVKQAVLMDGYSLPIDYTRTGRETMVAFRKNLDPKASRGETPLGIREGRALWRDSHTLFHSVKDKSEKPIMLTWLYNLVNAGVLSLEQTIPIDVFGLSTDRKKPIFWRHERLPLPLRYLRDGNLNIELQDALGVVEQVARLLQGGIRRLATLMFLVDAHLTNADWFIPRLGKQRREHTDKLQDKIEKKSHRDSDINNLVKSFAVELRYWSRLEADFRRLLVELARDEQKWQRERKIWWETLRRVAGQVFAEVASGIGVSTRSLRARAVAEAWFDGEMQRCGSFYLDPNKQYEPGGVTSVDDGDVDVNTDESETEESEEL
jgi:CRISPR system Cascade subunit CasA